MNEQQIEASVLAPFGPRLLKAKVPPAMLDTLNLHCEEILEIEGREELNLS